MAHRIILAYVMLGGVLPLAAPAKFACQIGKSCHFKANGQVFDAAQATKVSEAQIATFAKSRI